LTPLTVGIALTSASLTMPLACSTMTVFGGDVVTLTPRSSSGSGSRGRAVVFNPATRIVFTCSGIPRSRWMRRSGANTARTSVCCGRSANSPSRSRGSTPDSISRTVRPTSSLRPNSDSTGMSDGFCRRVSRTSPFWPPISWASAGEMNTPSTGARPWKFQKRSSTP
jgi:hypothetical protein